MAAILLAFSSLCFAQPKTKTTAKTTRTTAATADTVVKNLFAAQKADKGPFFQTKNRALVDQYFVKDLGDMIWKDAVAAKGELGAIDFDPLVGLQDPQITDLVVGKPRTEAGPDNVFVMATYKMGGKAGKTDFELRRGDDRTWKIVGIHYYDGEDLGSVLRYWQDEEFKKEYDNHAFKGEFTVGTDKCTVTPTLSGMSYRVQCNGSEDFKLYQVEGDETETAYIYVDDKGREKSRFVFKNGETTGKFIVAGKEVTVSPAK